MTAVVDASIGGYFGPSYGVRSDGRTVTWTGTEDGHDDQADVTPDPEVWARFWAAVDAAGAWGWEARYVDPNTTDGTSWAVRLEYDGRAVEATGSNAYPPGWKKVRAALEQLTGRPWR